MLGFNGGLIGKTRSTSSAQSVPGLWTAREQIEAKRANTWPVYLDQTLLLLRNDGSNGSTTFIDSSIYNRSVTRAGNTILSTATSKFGGSSAYFDGNGAKLLLASSSDFVFGSSDFTLEAWMYLLGGGSYARLMHFGPYWGSATAFGIVAKDADYSGKVTFACFKLGSRLCVSTTIIALNSWYHIAVSRHNGVFRLFVNGTLESTNSNFTADTVETASTNTLAIGSATTTSGTEDFYGYIDDVRITKGLARYTSTFTPPGAL